MSIKITTVKATPAPIPPDTYTISGLSLVEVRAIRTLLGGVAPARGSGERPPTYDLFCKLFDAGFTPLRIEPAEFSNDRKIRFKNNGKGE